MEKDGSNIIQVSIECEKTSASLIRPNFNFVIIPTRNKQRLRFVKVDAPNRAIMLLKSVYQGSHAIVPKLNGRRVQRHKYPWSVGNERCFSNDVISHTVSGGRLYPLLLMTWTQTRTVVSPYRNKKERLYTLVSMLGEDMVAGRDTDRTTKERACSQGSAVDCCSLRLKVRQRRLLHQSMHTGQPKTTSGTLAARYSTHRKISEH